VVVIMMGEVQVLYFFLLSHYRHIEIVTLIICICDITDVTNNYNKISIHTLYIIINYAKII